MSNANQRFCYSRGELVSPYFPNVSRGDVVLFFLFFARVAFLRDGPHQIKLDLMVTEDCEPTSASYVSALNPDRKDTHQGKRKLTRDR
jgi:hypothetical protein